MKILPILLLLSLSAAAQDKPVGGETGSIPLIRFRLEINDRSIVIRKAPMTDTIPALITAHHKIRPKSVTFYGYVVRNGKRSEYFDECWQKMPGTWVMTKIEKR